MAGKKENRNSLVEEAFQKIRRMILDLELLPGQTILLEELADRLRMSRTPVRQAVERLSSSLDGLLRTVPRKGIVVSFPDAETMREIYEIMQGLEGQAVRLIVGSGTEKPFAEMEEAIRSQERALGADDRMAWAEADRRFHSLLIASAGNKKLVELVDLFHSQLDRTRRATLHLRTIEGLRLSTREHQTLLEAIRAKDLGRALEIHSGHRERTIREMPRTVQDYLGMVLHSGQAESRV